MAAKSKFAQGRENNFKGRASENTLSGTFQSWEWTTAKPEPDIGVDLIVQTNVPCPSSGVTVAVQTKSKLSNTTRATLSFAAARRLRDQALPAFLFVHVRNENKVFWVYLEPLFRSNKDFLSNRPLKVRLTQEHSFSAAEQECPSLLIETLMAAKKRSGLKVIGNPLAYRDETRRYYSEIDPRFVVTPILSQTRSGFAIRALDQAVQLSYKVKTSDPRARTGIQDLLDWGSSLDIAAAVEFEGSDLFSELMGQKVTGQLQMAASPVWSGHGMLYGNEQSVVAVQVSNRQGRSGAEWTLEGPDGSFSCRLRFPFALSNASDVSVEFHIHFDRIFKWAACDIHKLDGLSSLLYGFRPGAAGAKLMLAGHPRIKQPIPLRWQSGASGALQGCIDFVASLDAMVWIAQKLNIDLDANAIGPVSDRQVEDWLACAAILRGERVELDNLKISFGAQSNPTKLADDLALGNFTICHGVWSFMLRGVEIGEIPVNTDFFAYEIIVEPDESGGSVVSAIPRGSDSKRIVYYNADQQQ